MSLRAVAGFFFGQLGAITGLAYYYGWVHSGSFLNYFGIDSSLVELSTTDYLIRAVEPAFIPLVILSVVAALAGTAHPRIVASLRTRGTHVQRRYALALATAGIVLAAVASYRTFIGSSSTPISDALTFAAGLLMINYGLLLPKPSGQFDQFRPGAVPQLALAVLVVVALFLAAGSYAYQNGSRSADVFAQTLAFRSNVRVFSSHPLGIATTGVAEFDSGDEGGLRYRYDGLSLLVRSGDRYLLIPKEWRSRSDPVVILREGDNVRFEFAEAGFDSSDASSPELLVIPDPVAVGNKFTVVGAGFEPFDEVTVWLSDVEIGVVRVEADTSFTLAGPVIDQSHCTSSSAVWIDAAADSAASSSSAVTAVHIADCE